MGQLTLLRMFIQLTKLTRGLTRCVFVLMLTILAPASKAWAVSVMYIDADGNEQIADATKLTGSEDASATTEITGICYVEGTVFYAGKIKLTGNTTIILCDGATMNIGTSNSSVNGCYIYEKSGTSCSLTIYGQSEQTGVLNIYTRLDGLLSTIKLNKIYTQHGGNVNVDNSNGNCFEIVGDDPKITLTRGSLTATSKGNTAIKFTSASGLIDMSGGTLTATSNIGTAISSNVKLSGGFLKAKGSYGIWGNVDMSGGILTATGDNGEEYAGIKGAVTLTGGDLTAKGNHGIKGNVDISGGELTATGTNKNGISGNVTFTGGNLTAIGGSNYAGISGNTTLDYTSGYDSFTTNRCTVSIANGKKFLDGYNSEIVGSGNVIDGTTTLTPDNRGIAVSTRIDLVAHDDGTGNYWATFYHPAVGFQTSPDATVYVAKVSGSNVALSEVATAETQKYQIPAGQAVILKATTDGITLTRYDGISEDFKQKFEDNNELKGGASVTPGKVAYTMSRGNSGTGTLGFYKFSGTSLGLYKAHLEIDPSSPSPARGFLGFGDDDNTTGIETIDHSPLTIDHDVYDLSGRRLNGEPVKKGIYVRNGQKFIVK